MSNTQERLREAARQLLAEGGVEVIIGFEQGTLPLRATPCFLREADQVDRLIWDERCGNNLAHYLHISRGKVGIVAKGCDARAIVTEIVERQVPRENVVVIGVPCQGVLDRRAVEERVGGREVLEAQIADGQVTVRGQGFEQILDLRELLCADCSACRHKLAPLHDVLIEAETQELAGSDLEYAAVEELESWTADERWAYFSSEFSRCIRCYACREACPVCYCKLCFIDQNQPSWFDRSDDVADLMAFHLGRLYHVAGRCIDCGACARACPMEIDLRRLGRKLEKDIRELYQYEAGMDTETNPPLGVYGPEDPEGVFK